MFTGIIEEVGTIKKLPTGDGQIIIAAKKILTDVKIGDSIAVNGICLTVTDYAAHYFAADVMPETLRRTSLTALSAGDVVNLERAVTPSSRLGGHIVNGHIDGTGKIVTLQKERNALLLTVAAEPKILRGIVPKGSVALDGISLTVAAIRPGNFTVSLIPQTLSSTNLAHKTAGDLLNIETDIIGKYVEKLLDGQNSAVYNTLTEDFLREHGF